MQFSRIQLKFTKEPESEREIIDLVLDQNVSKKSVN